MLSHNRLNPTNRYIALDVETTGLAPKNGDRVIEIGAVAIKEQGVMSTILCHFEGVFTTEKS